ncbi:putative cytosine DNA methyltransferase [Tetraselmis virus 1]|uniref:Putative cytosine DNA methyltransferase n=1 Tax=Tetraselmis virus 1 TaxID=2060617 RepID=A0A2P0VN45_9VIRU|nr:putative cytosine DNA methyltransferase [Tetraselmis virus 1]AUF82303.1 putative cytosine DNA methyltransferase [Tetraselmis virus 1]
MNKVKVLDLYAGKKSVEKTLNSLFPKKVEVVSVDIEPSFKPTICADMLELDYKSLWKPGEFDAIWSSSPCTWYSLARNSVPRDFVLADKLVKKAIEIIEYLQPKRWFMENPRAFMRLRPFMEPYNQYRKTVNYCKYSSRGDYYKYPKPTDIWTNFDFQPKTCNKNDRCKHFTNGCHPVTAQKGPSWSSTPAMGSVKSENVYRVPRKLISELFSGLCDL